MGQEVLISISVIIGIATLFTIIGRAIRQPPIIAYLIAGVLVGPLFLGIIGTHTPSSDLIETLARVGVAFLLFIVGLSLDFRVLKETGGVATLTGLIEIALVSSIGFIIALTLGYTYPLAFYIAAAIAFSSTVIVVKILSDKKQIDTLHGRIAIGILIVEDFVAAIVLMIIPTIQNHNLVLIPLSFVKIIFLIAVVFLLSAFVFNRFLHYLAKNQEVLSLFGIAWALTLASTFSYLGLSLEIGALVAGMSLASSKYTLELGGKIKPLRDFFVVLLFVFFGSQLAGDISISLIKRAILFSAIILIVKPFIIMNTVRWFGYTRRTNFLTGASLAQISEFSLIIILLGFNLGHIPQEIMSLIVLVSFITIGISSYSIYYAEAIFETIFKAFRIKGKDEKIKKTKEQSYEIVLFGYHRIGYKVLSSIKKLNKSFVVVDYNPKVILSLSKEKIPSIYGDAGDNNFLNEIPLEKAKLVISTIPDNYTNRIIKGKLDSIDSNAIFIATAEQPRVALDLYEEGVDYVILPHHLGGDYAANMIEHFKIDKIKYKEKGKKHLKELKKGKDSSSFT